MSFAHLEKFSIFRMEPYSMHLFAVAFLLKVLPHIRCQSKYHCLFFSYEYYIIVKPFHGQFNLVNRYMTQSAVLIIRIIRHTDQLVYTIDVSINISLELLNSMYSYLN